MRIRGAWLVAIGLVVAVAAASLLVASRAGAGADRCVNFREAARERSALVTGSGHDVLVIGDSYSVGLGVGAAESWPTRLPGRVHVDGFSGSGFTREASSCGDLSYGARATRSPAGEAGLVVVQGGLNDVDQTEAELVAGFERLLTALHDQGGDRRVLVVGPPSAPDRAHVVPGVDAVLAHLTERYDVGYLSMLDAELPYLDDGLHLTTDGHRQFGDLVAAALSTARAPGR